MLVHGRGSYPRIGWFDSIDCDELHALTRRSPTRNKSAGPSWSALCKNLVASTLERWKFFLSVSYSGQYLRLSNGRHGFDSRHRYSRATTRRSPTRMPQGTLIRIKTSWLRHSDARNTFSSVSYSGQYSRFSNGQSGFDSRHRFQAHPLDEALHAKKCWFDSNPVKAGSPTGRGIDLVNQKTNRGFTTRMREFFPPLVDAVPQVRR